MKKNSARCTVLSAVIALSLSVVAPAIAAEYPPTLKHSDFNDGIIAVGKPKVEPKPDVVKKAFTTDEVSKGEPIRILFGSLRVGAIVSPILYAPNGKKINLPKLVVNSNGTLDTKSLVFVKPGKYRIIFKLPNGLTKTVVIIVK